MFGCLWKWSIPVYPNDEPILSRLLSLKNNIDTYIYNIMSITEQSWTWLDLGVLTRFVIGWGNLCIMGRTQEYDAGTSTISFCPETALIPTGLPSLDLPCPHKSPPGPFPSNLDLTRTHWSQTCSLNVPADVQTEVGPWTMVQKKHFTSGQHPKTTGKLWALVLKSCLGHLPRHQAPESHMWYMPNRMSDRMSEYIYIYYIYIYIRIEYILPDGMSK